MLTNALLIRTAYGWDEAINQDSMDNFDRREALYGLGSNNSPADVASIAAARLAIIGTPRYQYDAGHEPTTDSDLAYHGYSVGDRMNITEPGGSPTAERVISIHVQENDQTGHAVATPTLNDVVLYASPLENFVAMMNTAVKKMIPGTGRGDWKEAQPVTPPALPSVLSPTPPAATCGFFDAPTEGFSNGQSIGSVAGGTASWSQSWDGSEGAAICAVLMIRGQTDTTAINVSSPSLSGCSMTWELLTTNDFVDSSGSNPQRSRACIFLGFGTPSNGTLTFNAGTTNSGTVNARSGVIGVKNLRSPDAGSIRQMSVSTSGLATLPAAPATCASVVGVICGAQGGDGYSAECGALGEIQAIYYFCTNPDTTAIFSAMLFSSTTPPQPTAEGGSVAIEFISPGH